MSDNSVQTVKIGGVTFNKADVKSSEVVVKDGKKMNSVFLQDGTHVEFPTQSEDNQSTVTQANSKYVEVTKRGPHATFKTKEDTSRKITNFNRMSGATITGTENQDTYNLHGCSNTKVDLSQDDGNPDVVRDTDSHTGSVFSGTNWKHDNNTFKLNDSDRADVSESLFEKDKHYKGKGTYNSGTGNK